MLGIGKMKFAVNHITVPHLSWLELLNFARDIGASGVEFRNDLSIPLFSGEIPEKVAEAVNNAGLQLFGLSQVYPFNSYTNQVEKKVCDLIDIAKRSGAQTISLIPNNDGKIETINEREAKLKFALNEIKPILEEAKMIALLEPLGFETSSMRTKEQAINAIDYVGGSSVFKLVHDTSHHHLAQENQIFPKHTKIVHISGVIDRGLSINEMRDRHRELIDVNDVLGNIEQIKNLTDKGYDGPISFEVFSPQVHNSKNFKEKIKNSLHFIQSLTESKQS